MKSFFTTANRDEYYRDHTISIECIEIQLREQSGARDTLYLTNGGFNVSFDSPTAPDSGINNYIAQGDFIGFSGFGEDMDVKVGKFTISLSAIGNDYANKFLSLDVEGARVCIYKAFLSFGPTGEGPLELVATPILMYDGSIYNYAINETANTCQVNLDCSSLFADFERTAGRKSNNWSNWLFQGSQYDACFEKSGWVGTTEFKWGKN
jgi:hypothetical protein